jgi:hypothetical protein
MTVFERELYSLINLASTQGSLSNGFNANDLDQFMSLSERVLEKTKLIIEMYDKMEAERDEYLSRTLDT